MEINNTLKINDRRTLIILPELNKNVYLSSRNLEYVDVVTVSELTTYKIANASNVFLSEKSVEVLETIFN